MTNEWAEFLDYTGAVTYAATSKSDTTYLGRFTFDTLLDFEGMARVLTILARGYLFHEQDGAPLTGDPRQRLEHARHALCAWCSLPEDRKTAIQEDWRFESDFSVLHEAFPNLVDEGGSGWFYRHVHAVADFALANPQRVRKNAVDKAQVIRTKFDAQWRKKLMQYQIPIFSPQTKGAWTLRFDDVLADALEQGPLRQTAVTLPSALTEKLAATLAGAVPLEMVETLITYYIASRLDDCDWVVLPVASFDAYFGDSSFGRKYLSKIPQEIIQRPDSGFGISRYRVHPEYLPEKAEMEEIGFVQQTDFN